MSEGEVYYVDMDERGNLVVRRASDDKVVSDPYRTKFMLCSARCARKCHYGTFDGKVFKCFFYDLEDTHPLRLVATELRAVLEAMGGEEERRAKRGR